MVIFLPAMADTGVMQERTARPSICTVQAPHWPSPQPKRGLFKPKIVAQSVKQRHVGIVDLDRPRPAVNHEGQLRHRVFLPFDVFDFLRIVSWIGREEIVVESLSCPEEEMPCRASAKLSQLR